MSKRSALILVACVFSLGVYKYFRHVERGPASEGGSEPQLSLQTSTGIKVFSRSELLKSKDIQKITVEKDPAYPGESRKYLAIPVARLFSKIDVGNSASVQLNCADGFSMSIEQQRLLNVNPNQSMAFLAIEPESGWPPLKKGSPETAGPFYLVWQAPEKSNIKREEWPFQLASLQLKGSFRTQYPATAPDKSTAENSEVSKGYALFMQNCFACHAMNGEGENKMGPDLNIPFSPVEYLKKDFLFTLIRDPQKLRQWPESKMHGFNVSELSDTELKQIVAYLSSMARKKAAPKPVSK